MGVEKWNECTDEEIKNKDRTKELQHAKKEKRKTEKLELWNVKTNRFELETFGMTLKGSFDGKRFFFHEPLTHIVKLNLTPWVCRAKPICNANLHPKAANSEKSFAINHFSCFMVPSFICPFAWLKTYFLLSVSIRIAQISSFTLAYFTGISFHFAFLILSLILLLNFYSIRFFFLL